MLQNGHSACKSRWKSTSSTLTIPSPFYFLSSFKLTYDTNGIHEGAAMWLPHLSWRTKPPPCQNQGSRCVQTRGLSARRRETLQRSVRSWATCWRCMLLMMCSLEPVLRPWGSLSHESRLPSCTASYFGQGPCVSTECTNSTHSTATLSKYSKTPVARACVYYAPPASMQPGKTGKTSNIYNQPLEWFAFRRRNSI